MAMQLRVVTPTRMLVDAEVTELSAPGVVGEFGVLTEHVMFLAGLDMGIVAYVEGGTKKKLVVHGGYTEVIDDVITVLADDAEFAEEIDAADARAELERVEGELAKDQDSPATVEVLLRERRRAELRIEAGC